MIVSVAIWLQLVANRQVTFPKDPPFEADIRKFETEDAKNPPKPGGIVFVGSSSIRLWTTLANDFPQYNVINRGFGGSQISDSIRYADRIVTKYKPKVVVFFAGTNDLASGKPAEAVSEDFRQFATKVRAGLPKTRIIYLSITPAPSRWSGIEEVRRANELIKRYAMSAPFLFFVDMYDEFVTASGDPRPELFVEDQLHMNKKGYEIWTQRLTPILDVFLSDVSPKLQVHSNLIRDRL